MKQDFVFLFMISSSLPEIFKVPLLCKLATDDITRGVSRIKNISGKKRQCNGYLACIFNHIKYNLWRII